MKQRGREPTVRAARRTAAIAPPAASPAPAVKKIPTAGAVVALAVPAVVLARLLPGSTPARLLVDFDGAARPARTTLALDAAAVARALATGQRALLVFEGGHPDLPIVTGLLQGEAPSPLQELLMAPRAADPPAPAPREAIEARLDGKRVVLEGKNEVVLKCGDASITLRRDGKVIVRGIYVETHARGVNRIKGGAVKIN